MDPAAVFLRAGFRTVWKQAVDIHLNKFEANKSHGIKCVSTLLSGLVVRDVFSMTSNVTGSSNTYSHLCLC